MRCDEEEARASARYATTKHTGSTQARRISDTMAVAFLPQEHSLPPRIQPGACVSHLTKTAAISPASPLNFWGQVRIFDYAALQHICTQ